MENIREKELVAEVRKRESSRAWRSRMAVVLGAVLLVAAWITTYKMLGHAVLSETVSVSYDAKNAVVTGVESASYWWGVAVGFATSLAWLLAIHFIVGGFAEMRGGEQQRALLDALDRLSDGNPATAS